MTPCPLVILVTGPPASGKTTVAGELSRRLKERLFETLGVRDREWSRTLGKASILLLFDVAASHVAAGQSVILDANFVRDLDSTRAASLSDIGQVHFVQVVCKCPDSILRDRFRRRVQSGQRHKGHQDWGNMDEFDALSHSPLDLPGTVVEVDTRDLSGLCFETLEARIRAAA